MQILKFKSHIYDFKEKNHRIFNEVIQIKETITINKKISKLQWSKRKMLIKKWNNNGVMESNRRRKEVEKSNEKW